jgi:hypothetical protein
MSRVRRWIIVLALAGPFAACGRPPPATSAPPRHVDPHLTPAQLGRLERLIAAADAAPGDFAARRESGMAHLRLALAGVLRLQPRAEADLEAAFALRPDDADLTRALGRFYNLRAVAGDRSKASVQVQVYAAHLGTAKVPGTSTAALTAWSFSRLGAILDLRNRGSLLGALSAVKEVEDVLEQRVLEHPDDIELRALAGNFAFFFAGNVPFDRRERVRRAVGHFEIVRARWDELRRGARHPEHCPNTRENFMFELAEGYLALGEVDAARPIHEELTHIREPYTRPKEQIAFVSAERLAHAAEYAGRMELMPPWPSDAGNCVVCHSWTADVPMDSLYALEPIGVQDIPRRRAAKPIPW